MPHDGQDTMSKPIVLPDLLGLTEAAVPAAGALLERATASVRAVLSAANSAIALSE